MGLDVKGRVEIRSLNNPDFWRGVVDLSALDLRDNELFDLLFWNEPNEIVEFTMRDLPANRSHHTLRDWSRWLNADKHASSWVMWEELKPHMVKIMDERHFSGQWDVLYSLCKVLAKGYAPDRVRVVWWLK